MNQGASSGAVNSTNIAPSSTFSLAAPTSSATLATTTQTAPPTKHARISTKAGIGIGVALGILLLITLSATFFFLGRRVARVGREEHIRPDPGDTELKAGTNEHTELEYKEGRELENTQKAAELENTQKAAELEVREVVEVNGEEERRGQN